MEFLTPEQVKIEAEKGEIPALECSLKHHRQGETATRGELISAIEDKRFGVMGGFCSCCYFTGFNDNKRANCGKCSLNPTRKDSRHSDEICCDGLWDIMRMAFRDLTGNYSNANLSKFQTAEAKLCTYIEGVLERKRAEQEKYDGACQDCKHHDISPSNTPCDRCWGTEKHSGFKSKESKPALTYSIGDRFIDDSGIKRMLVAVCSTSCKTVAWVELKSGHCSNISVKDWHNITPKEISSYIDSYTRYWDSQKKELLDLALRAEDLTEFEINDRKDTDRLEFTLCENDIIVWFNRKGEDIKSMNIQPDRGGLELYQKLGQMLAFAKRKQKSK